MSENRASLEIIAPTVEEAIEKGLEDLGLPQDAVDIEILDSGNRGLFGFGSRQARVRLTIKGAERSQKVSAPANQDEPSEQSAEPTAAAELPTEMPLPVEIKPVSEAQKKVEDDFTLQVARDTVMDLLERMKITHAEVTAQFGEADDAHSKAPVLVDVQGNDLSILIGPRAETLNALQYIAGLIVGKELGHSIPMVVDVEGYRKRREQQIRRLARRVADQAVKTGRRQMLEPMPANERRLVHIELRDNPDVTTQSVGEDPRRKVTIIPEK
ncbi:MAG: RNA-binding cell elongation regulator Jag/EloR [Anaerolineales bacterium]|jgi:spoIIIJ-associated protein